MGHIRFSRDIVSHTLNRLFQSLGEYVGLHPLPFLIIPVVITLLLSTGMIMARIDDNAGKLYTPVGAPSQAEAAASARFYNSTNHTIVRGLSLYFYVTNDTDENMLAHNRSQFVHDFHKFVVNELNYTHDGQEYNYGRRVCENMVYSCDIINKPITTFLTVYNSKKLLSNPNVDLEYPVLEAFGFKFFLGFQLLGVPMKSNRSGTIDEARLMRLQYMMDLGTLNATEEEYEAFQSTLLEHVHSVRGERNIEIIPFSPRIMDHEVDRNTIACIPYVVLTFSALTIFTVLSTMTSNLVTAKPFEAIMGTLACVMAIASTLGICFYCGLAFNSAVSVMPFLAFAIGIDDTFIALSAWHSTDASLPPHKRLSLSLRESGTAITVTSLTDVVLFGLCALTTTPAIRVFSIFTAVAMAFDYFYQLTFFSAVMAYAGRREALKINSFTPVCCWKNRGVSPPEKSINNNNDDHLSIQFIQKKLNSDWNSTELIVSRLIRTRLAPFLSKPLTKMLVFLLYLGYLVVSIYGITKMKVDISPSKSLMDDSPLTPYFEIQKRYLWEFVEASIFVRNAPDFRNETEQVLFDSFLQDLESSPFACGSASTFIWYRDYQDFIQYIDHKPEEFYTYFKEFLDISVHSMFKGGVHWNVTDGMTYKNDTNATVSEFLFGSGFSSRQRGWDGRLALLRSWRNISARYPQYDLVFYEPDNFFVDQYDALTDETIQQVGIALLGMQLMAAVFIPHLSSVFWIGWTLLSMDFGIIGLLMLWGCDLDTTSMINIVMSLDFAVEYAAHICYRYYISKEVTERERVIDTLAAIGWPVMQGAMAAIIAVLPLTAVRSYIVSTFLKTVILVVGIGLIHGLIVLPVFLSTVSRLHYLPSKSAAKVRQKLMAGKLND